VISTNVDRLEKIKGGVCASVSPDEAAFVTYHQPDSFIAHLRELAIQDAALLEPPNVEETKFGKYKVTRRAAKLTPDEMRQREAAKMKMITDTMRKKPGNDTQNP
jgi:hypothetical protein